MLGELLQLNLFAFFLIFSRVGTVMMVLPGFSAAYVSVRARLIIALAISFVLTPLLMKGLPVMPGSATALSLLILDEVIVGAVIGLTVRILVGALQTAGMLMSLMSSLANALIQDPIAEQQSSVISSFLGTLGIVLIFVTNMHYLMLRAVVDSYSLFPPGQPLPFGDFSLLMARRVADSFRLGVQLAAPFVIVSIVFNTGLGILGRLMQALPVFFVAMPLLIWIQLTLLAASLSTMMMYFLSRYEEGFFVFLGP